MLQCYLRPAGSPRPPSHEVVRRARGWVDLGRADARLWVGSPGEAAPDGLRLAPEDARTVVVWQLDARRPDWAL